MGAEYIDQKPAEVLTATIKGHIHGIGTAELCPYHHTGKVLYPHSPGSPKNKTRFFTKLILVAVPGEKMPFPVKTFDLIPKDKFFELKIGQPIEFEVTISPAIKYGQLVVNIAAQSVKYHDEQ